MSSKDKFELSYTRTGSDFVGYHHEYFKTRNDAEQWVKDNQDLIYWSQITETNPASQKPKVFIDELPDLNAWHRYEGILEIYYETGMECLGLVLYTDEPRGDLNTNFDHFKPEDNQNFRFYKSFDAVKFIKHGDLLELDGVRYAMKKDHAFMKADCYRLSLYPQGFSKQELIELFMPASKRAVLWTMKDEL